MAYLPRGIDPELLSSQVKNTMPYLFESGVETTPLGHFPPAQVLKKYEVSLSSEVTERLSHFEYFRLCVSAHYLTCGTPVPTDVDNQIRRKLWPAELPLEVALEMAQLVLESRGWDFTQVSSRFTYGALGTDWEKEALSGHLGEWFTVASAAYCALKQYADPLAQDKRKQLLEQIAAEVLRHSEIFGSLWRAKDGLNCLKAAASIAHNFGDLDRVMDMWELDIGDPLRLNFYKLGTTPFDPDKKLRYLGRLWVAGELYKSSIESGSMAFENHRHFALRKPRCLRQSPVLLIPTGPFFDDWGKRVARSLMSPDGTPSENTHEVVEALKHGWDRLPKTVGYGRALRGITEVHPEIHIEGLTHVNNFRSVLEMPQERFEKKWNDQALREMDDIPSRA
ncbi:MAG: hypothetical protein ABI041_18100 [Bdellovibrionia bacterium]